MHCKDVIRIFNLTVLLLLSFCHVPLLAQHQTTAHDVGLHHRRLSIERSLLQDLFPTLPSATTPSSSHSYPSGQLITTLLANLRDISSSKTASAGKSAQSDSPGGPKPQKDLPNRPHHVPQKSINYRLPDQPSLLPQQTNKTASLQKPSTTDVVIQLYLANDHQSLADILLRENKLNPHNRDPLLTYMRCSLYRHQGTFASALQELENFPKTTTHPSLLESFNALADSAHQQRDIFANISAARNTLTKLQQSEVK